MTTKVVVRLLDPDQHLLGWTEVQAIARGDGRLWSPGVVRLPVEASGVAAYVSVHWADVHVEQRAKLDRHPVSPGEIVTVFPHASPIFTVGPIPGYLPAVTIHRQASIILPVAQLGAQG